MTDVTVSYGATLAIEHATFTVPVGSVMGLIGPNGAGKSTIIKAGLELMDHTGDVRFFGKPLEEVRRKVAYMPQVAAVDWDYPITVEQVVTMGMYTELGWLRRANAAHRSRVMEVLDRVGIADLAKRQISELSGGQRRRVFVARILVQAPELYLLDEPFAGDERPHHDHRHGPGVKPAENQADYQECPHHARGGGVADHVRHE